MRVNGNLDLDFGYVRLTSYAGLELLRRYVRAMSFNRLAREASAGAGGWSDFGAVAMVRLRIAWLVVGGRPPRGAFYAFLAVDPDWRRRASRLAAASGDSGEPASTSWALAEYLIRQGRVGCIPGVDFGPRGEGFLRFCFARDRSELAGALAAMTALFSPA